MTVGPRPYLVPFRLEHLNEYINRDTGVPDNIPMARFLKFDTNPSYTIICDDKILGCAGIVLMGSGYGIGWMSLSKDIEHHGYWFARTARRIFRDIIRSCSLYQVEAFIVASKAKNQLWATFLGFQREDDHIRFTYVRRR